MSVPANSYPKSIKTTLNMIFPMQCCVESQGQHYIKIFLCNVVPGDDTLGAILRK